MPLKKTYLKSKDECKVTFRLPKEQAATAQTVKLIGDFNDWETQVNPMKKLKSGEFTQTINLPKNKRYAFRYLVDDKEWQNDWAADAYIPNELTFDDNSVVEV
ncbi:isoamylase early set domain-containing protein [Alteromonas sp. LMIT006]|jgi:1,4-alpha-glucan branching enzyme|uniref:isoamylase early set domain-containing protein n=1 Tax=Alteromonadaceae TaxID=72275 RepID=UPI0020CA6DAB|nr:isoamylase early set domain-containing protein [Alteromonas sp. LMIT006]UTP72018.1 isoamylase early set domain-containing protein [Alteromonas sp. LMIT006]